MRPEQNINNYNDMGKLLLELRKEEGINIQQQCEKFGYKHSVINKVSIGERHFSKFALRHILDMYKDRPSIQRKLIMAWVTDEQKQMLKSMGFDDEKNIMLYAMTNLGMVINA